MADLWIGFVCCVRSSQIKGKARERSIGHFLPRPKYPRDCKARALLLTPSLLIALCAKKRYEKPVEEAGLPKASVSKRDFMWNHLYKNELLSCQSNSFSCERFPTRTRFDAEAQSNSEVAYLLPVPTQNGGCQKSNMCHKLFRRRTFPGLILRA